MSSEKWSDEELVEFIKEGGERRKQALAFIYKNSVLNQRIINFVRHKGGTEDEAQEVYLESILLTDRNIRNDKFKGQSSIVTYTYAIAKYTWFNLIRKKKTDLKTVHLDATNHDVTEYQNPELQFIQDELKVGLEKVMTLLSDKCRMILRLWSNDAKYDEIAERLGVENNGSLRKQKLTCIRKLKEYLMSHPSLIPNYYHGEF